MSASEIAWVAALALVAAAHFWLGERWLLPSLFASAQFPKSFFFDATPAMRRFLRIAWNLGAVAWLWFAVLVAFRGWLDSRHAQGLVMAPMVFMLAPPVILGAYFATLLKAKIGTPSLGVTILLWVALLLVISAAWHAA